MLISLTCPLSVYRVEESRKNAFVNGDHPTYILEVLLHVKKLCGSFLHWWWNVRHKSKCATKQPSQQQKNAERTPECCNKCFQGITKTIIVVFFPPCSFGNEHTSVMLGSPREVKTQWGQIDVESQLVIIFIFMFVSFPSKYESRFKLSYVR